MIIKLFCQLFLLLICCSFPFIVVAALAQESSPSIVDFKTIFAVRRLRNHPQQMVWQSQQQLDGIKSLKLDAMAIWWSPLFFITILTTM
jgi:hypothetical protein